MMKGMMGKGAGKGMMMGMPGVMQGMQKPAFPAAWGAAAGTGGGGGEFAVCALHGKKRSLQSMQDDGMGGYSRAPGMECQTGGFGAGGKGAFGGGGGKPSGGGAFAVCSVHGKQRSVQSLQDDGMGGYACAPGMECQTGGQGGAAAWAGGGGGGFGASTDQAKVFCSTHGKQRSADCLQDDGAGGFCCTPEFACKTGGEGGGKGAAYTGCGNGGSWGMDPWTMMMMGMKGKGCKGKGDAKGCKGKGFKGAPSEQATCSLHQKNRSKSIMQDDGMGGFACTPGNECKAPGAPYNGASGW